jgi:hypothetical protein
VRALPTVSLAVLTTFAIGLRHGLDWDHLTAITDITGAELRRRRAAALALLYAAGHGVMVFALGLAAVAAGRKLPAWIDPAMERIVGATILLLAVTLLRSLRSGAPGPRSRGAVLFGFLTRARDRFRHDRVVEVEHEHPHNHVGMHRHEPAAVVPAVGTVRTAHRHAHRHEVTWAEYGAGGALAVGALHAFGAETGTQAVVLVSATGANGAAAAVAILGAFVIGVFATTGCTTIVATLGWANASQRPALLRGITVTAATISLVVGLAFVCGRSDLLPPLLGGYH